MLLFYDVLFCPQLESYLLFYWKKLKNILKMAKIPEKTGRPIFAYIPTPLVLLCPYFA
jgi:hypothetical protein